jgi:ParB/RepB/Spo0J family partition protein
MSLGENRIMANEQQTMKEETKYVLLSEVHADFDWNARHKSFREEKPEVDESGKPIEPDAGSFLSIVKSIQTNGQDEAVTVRPSTKGKKPYDLVAGFRRYEALVRSASEKVNVPKGGTLDAPLIKIQIRNLSEQEAQSLNGRENIERENLSTCDQAFIVKRMLATGMTDVRIAAEVGMSNGHISQLHRIVEKMAPEILDRWRNEKVVQASLSLDKLEKISKEEGSKKQAEKLDEFMSSGSTKGGNKGKWIDSAIRQATAIGTLLGTLEFAELIDTGNLDLKKHVKSLVAGDILIIKGKDGKATDNQWDKIGEAAQNAWEAAMNPPEEEESPAEEKKSKNGSKTAGAAA